MTSVVVVDRAAQQLRDIDTWWREHRLDAETMVVDEFERCVTLLENTPELGAPFRRRTCSAFGAS